MGAKKKVARKVSRKLRTYKVCLKIDGKEIGCAEMKGRSKASVKKRFERQWLKTKVKK